jgi:hypothetical protein
MSADRKRLPIGMLALLLAIFGWGLEYKTSLYQHWRDPHPSSIPPAKLLAEGEKCDIEKLAASSIDSSSQVKVSSQLLPAAGFERERSRFEQPLSSATFDARRKLQRQTQSFIRPPPFS